MNFSDALNMVKENEKVARRGWNGKGMFIFLVDGVGLLQRFVKYPAMDDDVEPLPYIAMYTAQRKVVPWLASQTDILSDDWVVL